MNILKVSLSWRCASAPIVSNTMDDLPEPDTPVKIVIFRFGISRETFFRLFSLEPLILIYSFFISENIFESSTSSAKATLQKLCRRIHYPPERIGYFGKLFFVYVC